MTLPFDVVDLDAIAADAAHLARRAVSAGFDVVEKDDHSPVTAVDHAVNAFLSQELCALVPESGWLSEESVDDRARLSASLVWIVDPIDGTKQLVSGIPEVAISIGLSSAGRVVAAAIVNPMTGESGAWVDGKMPIFRGLRAAPVPSTLDAASAIVSRSESEDGELDRFAGVVGATRAVGSIAYKLLRVASGADALIFSIRSKSEWDVCAGVGLLQAAGRVYLRLDGLPVVFNRPDTRMPSGAVAGPAALAEPLRDRLLALTA